MALPSAASASAANRRLASIAALRASTLAIHSFAERARRRRQLRQARRARRRDCPARPAPRCAARSPPDRRRRPRRSDGCGRSSRRSPSADRGSRRRAAPCPTALASAGISAASSRASASALGTPDVANGSSGASAFGSGATAFAAASSAANGAPRSTAALSALATTTSAQRASVPLSPPRARQAGPRSPSRRARARRCAWPARRSPPRCDGRCRRPASSGNSATAAAAASARLRASPAIDGDLVVAPAEHADAFAQRLELAFERRDAVGQRRIGHRRPRRRERRFQAAQAGRRDRRPPSDRPRPAAAWRQLAQLLLDAREPRVHRPTQAFVAARRTRQPAPAPSSVEHHDRRRRRPPAQPASAAKFGERPARSHAAMRCGRSNQSDARASAGVLGGGRRGSARFGSLDLGRRQVDGRRVAGRAGPGGPPGGSLELVMSCPLAIHSRPRHTSKSRGIRTPESRRSGCHQVDQVGLRRPLGDPDGRRRRRPTSGSATCRDRQ